MAKVTKKKVNKKSSKKNCEETDKSAAARPGVIYDFGDEDDLNEADENIRSAEEEEDYDGEDERKRQKLLEAISALGGNKKKNPDERSEAAVHVSEFTVNAEGEGDKIDLSDLIGTMEKTPGISTKTKKQLKNLQQSKKTIECPLSKQESERIQRDVAFQKAATEVTKWTGVIKQNQKAEQLVFPLNQETSGNKPMERVVTGWKAQTPLEQEIFALLSANKQPINDPILTTAEESSVRAMSLEEAKIRRAELQKARALQSYYEAKARRERKIKSKKYHKVHNKAKCKEYMKQFHEMVKKDPATALEELEKIELARMQERMSLKHQNSGKWAKSKAIMAKYDDGARKAMQQQLEMNKELTQKLMTSLNSEEDKDADNDEVLPDFVNDAEQVLDPSNPWMRGKLSEDLTEKELNEISDAVDHTADGPRVLGNIAEEEDKVEETEEELLLREFEGRRKMRQAQEADTVPVIPLDDDEETLEENKDAVENPESSEKVEEELSEFTNLVRGIADDCREAEATAEGSHLGTQLDEGLMKIRTLEDMELLNKEESVTDNGLVQTQHLPTEERLSSAPLMADKNRKRKREIELKEVLTKNTKVIEVPLAPTIEDIEESDQKLIQRGLIKEAFAGDDVISDFIKDKGKQEAAGKPKMVDLTLPGWGEWGGTGVNPPRNKRRRFRIRTAPAPPRKDQHLPSVIISEKRNGSLSLHQVSSLPFPFENRTQFESTIRSPLGRTWNTEQTVKKIIKPKVITKLGAIIQPMAQEELMKDKKQGSARNKSSTDSSKGKHNHKLSMKCSLNESK